MSDTSSMSQQSALLVAFGAAVVLLLFKFLSGSRKSKLPTVPGPSGWPIVGNLFQLGEDAAITLGEWAQTYGPVFKIKMGEREILVVNSAQAAQDLFVGKGSVYISRPFFHTFHGVVSSTAGFTIGTSMWDDSCKKKRRVAATALNRPAVQTYVPIVDVECHALVSDIYNSCGDGQTDIYPYSLMQRYALNTSLVVNYGVRCEKTDDAMFQEIIEVETLVANFRSVTNNYADYIPILRYFKSSKGQSLAVSARKRRDVYMDKLLNDLKAKIASGTDIPCITGNVIKNPEAKLTDLELSSICLSMVSAGLDTLANTMIWSVGYLATRPDIQERAYNEIYKVYQGAIPDSSEETVDYITALHKECSRFFSVLKLALPRETQGDSEYKSHKIPDGTTVFLNAWAIHHDEERYPDNLTFNPERYLRPEEETLQAHYGYGAGRRMCAGAFLANRELYIAFCKLIHFFKIERSLDPEKQKYDINPATACANPYGLSSTPKEFRIRFVPRNKAALASWLEEQKAAGL